MLIYALDEHQDLHILHNLEQNVAQIKPEENEKCKLYWKRTI